MTSLVKESFSLNLLILKILGLFPVENYKKLYMIYAWVFYIFVTAPVPILATIYLVLNAKCMPETQAAQSGLFIAEMGILLLRYLPLIVNASEIRSVIYTLDIPLFNIFTKRSEKIIDNCVSICKKMSYFFMVFCIASAVAWSTSPIVMGNYNMPTSVWVPFDITIGSKAYISVYITVVLESACGALVAGSLDTLIAGLALHATSQIMVLKDKLQYLGEDAEEEIAQNHSDMTSVSEKESLKADIIYKKISHCVIHYEAVVNFVQCYGNAFSFIVFTQFVASVVVICVTCFEITIVEPLSYKFFGMVIFIITMLFQIFFYCYFGTRLYEESNTLTDSIYMGKWYEYDIKSKKALCILMERGKRPIIVTVGKIFDLSLVTFMTVLRRAYSLLAVLNNY